MLCIASLQSPLYTARYLLQQAEWNTDERHVQITTKKVERWHVIGGCGFSLL